MKLLRLTTAVEAVTGLALLADPALVVRLLLGAQLSGVAPILARCFGAALLALALGCWPGAEATVARRGPVRGMLAYNGLIALCLAYAGGVEGVVGPLLWPAVALHGVIALLLFREGMASNAGR